MVSNVKQLNPKHPMTKMMQDRAVQFIGLILWKIRPVFPNLSITITTQDMEEMINSFHPGQTPVVAILGNDTQFTLRLVDQESGAALLKRKEGGENSPAAIAMAKSMKAHQDARGIAFDLSQLIGPAALTDEHQATIFRAIDALQAIADPEV